MINIRNIATAVLNVICYSCRSFSYLSAIKGRREEDSFTPVKSVVFSSLPDADSDACLRNCRQHRSDQPGRKHKGNHQATPPLEDLCSCLVDTASLKCPRAVTDLSLQTGTIAQSYAKTLCEPQPLFLPLRSLPPPVCDS